MRRDDCESAKYLLAYTYYTTYNQPLFSPARCQYLTNNIMQAWLEFPNPNRATIMVSGGAAAAPPALAATRADTASAAPRTRPAPRV